ncbi:hydrogenase maturation nickel metallochaperone HypA/HybF [Geomesophilobacter sediminis]|uniref:Hydrogenase maturation factor HypA n=1 Tax=Geomesophilobacter sediminis TaxID=2798584 RepID=A0A8J7LXV3_9BACT|nr:hydrogenase maturation nickel metallochaperone HypA [Geomesophilobacter sediminis]MBJ6723751.1 hydrogenase maturation nickel metallochaperone HypA [Geomesophilobacter sediminis]
MHEMSITQSVIELCEGHAAGRPVKVVVLKIGALSGVVPESVEFCFEACSRGTLLEGAVLEIELVPGVGRCPACAKESQVETLFDPCPHCGAFGLELISGEELLVKELEID